MSTQVSRWLLLGLVTMPNFTIPRGREVKTGIMIFENRRDMLTYAQCFPCSPHVFPTMVGGCPAEALPRLPWTVPAFFCSSNGTGLVSSSNVQLPGSYTTTDFGRARV